MSEWINVEDRLPEPNYFEASVPVAYVLAYGDIVSSCLYMNKQWFIGADKTIGITHWMELPEPPVIDKKQ